MMGGHHAISGAAAWLALTGTATIGDWSLGAGVLNLTDRDPPAVQGFLGYDSRTHDPRGRLWYVELNRRI